MIMIKAEQNSESGESFFYITEYERVEAEQNSESGDRLLPEKRTYGKL
jgi:hypothetical protein